MHDFISFVSLPLNNKMIELHQSRSVAYRGISDITNWRNTYISSMKTYDPYSDLWRVKFIREKIIPNEFKISHEEFLLKLPYNSFSYRKGNGIVDFSKNLLLKYDDLDDIIDGVSAYIELIKL